MIANLQELPTRTEEGAFRVIVESPRGSQVKLKYNAEYGIFEVSRPLILGLTYPFDWGFVPSTNADDGDPLDALILWDVPTAPGVVIPCRAVAVVKLEQNGDKRRERNDRVIALPLASARGADIRGPDDIAKRVRDELDRFFIVVTGFAKKDAKILGWGDAEEAEKLVEKSRIRKKKKR